MARVACGIAAEGCGGAVKWGLLGDDEAYSVFAACEGARGVRLVQVRESWEP